MPSRTRNKGAAYTTISGSYTAKNGPSKYQWTAVSFFAANETRYRNNNPAPDQLIRYTDNAESMTDVIGQFGADHAVTHYKNDVTSVLGETKKLTLKSTYNAIPAFCEYVQTGITDMRTAVNTSHLTVSNAAAVADSKVPSVAPDLLRAYVSIYELKDIISSSITMINHVLHARRRALLSKGSNNRNMKKVLSELLNGLKENPAQAVKSLIGADLAWKFGWAPFIKDSQSTIQAFQDLDRELEKLFAKSFTVYGRSIQKASLVSTPSSNVEQFAGTSIDVKIARTTEATFSTWSKRKLSPSAMGLSEAQLKSRILASKLGASLKLTDVWEVVPYSFIADWFLPIQDFIGQFQQQPAPEWITVVSSGRSVKTVTRTTQTNTRRAANGSTGITISGNVSDTLRCTRSSYTRTVGGFTPPPLYVPSMQLPHVGQVFTGMELLLQRFLR